MTCFIVSWKRDNIYASASYDTEAAAQWRAQLEIKRMALSVMILEESV